jgi:hypothetical protein
MGRWWAFEVGDDARRTDGAGRRLVTAGLFQVFQLSSVKDDKDDDDNKAEDSAKSGQ